MHFLINFRKKIEILLDLHLAEVHVLVCVLVHVVIHVMDAPKSAVMPVLDAVYARMPAIPDALADVLWHVLVRVVRVATADAWDVVLHAKELVKDVMLAVAVLAKVAATVNVEIIARLIAI